MKSHQLSRRRLLGGLLAGLAAWLCPHPPRAAAAPRRPVPSIALPPRQFVQVSTYAYDGSGRLFTITDHPPRASELIRRIHVTHEHGVTYIYDCG